MPWRRAAVCLIAVLLPIAGGAGAMAAESGLLPDIPGGKGDACVEDTAVMRRQHMNLLKHERDETVLEGIRGGPYSLVECIDCHAVNGPEGTPVSASSPKHFCRVCHDYSAVQIDCFQCHTSLPEAAGGGHAEAVSGP